MSEWWTYSLSDFLLFSPRTYYRLFELYNQAVWPWQVVALGLGLAVLVLWLRGRGWYERSWREWPWSGRVIATILAACWLWVAWAFLAVRYDTINWAASYFAIGFAFEAALLLLSGLVLDRLRLRPGRDMARSIGLVLFLIALFVWPLIGVVFGRPWQQAEVFGVAPDPTVVATLGVLLAAERVRWELIIIPLVWCMFSGATLWTMQSPDALLMPAAALVAMVLAGWKTVAPDAMEACQDANNDASDDRSLHGERALERDRYGG